MKKRKKLLIILAVIFLILAGVLTWVFLLAGRTNFRRDEDVEMLLEAIETESEPVLHAADIYDLSAVTSADESRTKDTFTLLVIGGDTMENEEQRSDADAIILMTINHRDKTVYFETFHVDLYAQIPDVGGGRLANAYAVGGGPLLSRTLEENYGIVINNYAAISLKEVARIIGIPDFENLNISEDGLDVVEQLVYSLGAKNPVQVMSYISQVLPYVTHNIEKDELLRIAMTVPTVIGYYSEKSMLPYEDLVQELDGYLVPDIGASAARLQQTIYG